MSANITAIPVINLQVGDTLSLYIVPSDGEPVTATFLGRTYLNDSTALLVETTDVRVKGLYGSVRNGNVYRLTTPVWAFDSVGVVTSANI